MGLNVVMLSVTTYKRSVHDVICCSADEKILVSLGAARFQMPLLVTVCGDDVQDHSNSVNVSP